MYKTSYVKKENKTSFAKQYQNDSVSVIKVVLKKQLFHTLADHRQSCPSNLCDCFTNFIVFHFWCHQTYHCHIKANVLGCYQYSDGRSHTVSIEYHDTNC